jgi:epoxyqueuosine reductase QueG
VAERVRHPVDSGISKWLYRHFSQEVCPWNVSFAKESNQPGFAARDVIAGKDARKLATELLAMSQGKFSAECRKSQMKRAKLPGLKRNASVVIANSVIEIEEI